VKIYKSYSKQENKYFSLVLFLVSAVVHNGRGLAPGLWWWALCVGQSPGAKPWLCAALILVTQI